MNAPQEDFVMRFVLLGGEKDRHFFIGPRASIAAPKKEKTLNVFVLLGGEKLSLFFHWPPPPRLACIELRGRKTVLSY